MGARAVNALGMLSKGWLCQQDIYHDIVKNALLKDGWTITHDPLVLRWGTTDVYVDLGAEQLLAAEKHG